jgi:hypothetical protein
LTAFCQAGCLEGFFSHTYHFLEKDLTIIMLLNCLPCFPAVDGLEKTFPDIAKIYLGLPEKQKS